MPKRHYQSPFDSQFLIYDYTYLRLLLLFLFFFFSVDLTLLPHPPSRTNASSQLESNTPSPEGILCFLINL